MDDLFNLEPESAPTGPVEFRLVIWDLVDSVCQIFQMKMIGQ